MGIVSKTPKGDCVSTGGNGNGKGNGNRRMTLGYILDNFDRPFPPGAERRPLSPEIMRYNPELMKRLFGD